MATIAAFLMAILTLGFLALLVRFLVRATLESSRLSEKDYPEDIVPSLAESLFSQATEELRFQKTLQWNIVSYCLLVTGGLVAVGTTEQIRNNEIIPYVLLTLGWATALVGIYLVLETQHNLRLSRISMFKMKMMFRVSHYWMSDLELDRQTKLNTRLVRDPRLLILFVVAVIAGFLLLVYVLFETLNPCDILSYYS